MPEVREQVIEMTLNGSGVRDIARVLKISPTTVIEVLKGKKDLLQQINPIVRQLENPEEIEVEIRKVEDSLVEEAELDEMWSFVSTKTRQRWLWHAVDHRTGQVLAYVFGSRKDAVFLELKRLLEPFGIKRFYTDGHSSYERHLARKSHQAGKRNTQKIERKHLTLRTRIKRLARKTICFSKSILMHRLHQD
jgi:insertion element IS1 protein InsB